jgi:hypothetical protein
VIWLTWRQHRRQALFTVLAVAALAALMVPTGLHMHHVFDDSGLAACQARLGGKELIAAGTPGCSDLRQRFNNQFVSMSMVAILLIVLPLLVGLFFGAPLVAKEVEYGTHRFVWTQGVSRRRWALVKFGLVGTVVAVLAAAYALGGSWWFKPMATNGNGRLAYCFFDVQGIAPIGYTLFALALGIFAGTLWHKVLPAMAATLGGYAVVRVGIELLARPHYLPAKTLTYGLQSTMTHNPAVGDWIFSTGIRDAAGKLIAANSQVGCPPPTAPGGPAAGIDCLRHTGFKAGDYNWQLYQPADRFWLFQSIETGIFVVLTAVLLYLAVRRIRRIS